MVATTPWRRRCTVQWNVDFACVNCYIFANCSQILASTSNLSSSLGSQWNVDSNDILSIWKYYQLFTHESNTFLLQNTSLKPLGQWGKRPQNPPIPLRHVDPYLIHDAWVTPLIQGRDQDITFGREGLSPGHGGFTPNPLVLTLALITPNNSSIGSRT